MTLLLAMILDAVFGEPRAIWDRWSHPAVVMGRAIGWMDARFNDGPQRRLKGALSLAVLLAVGMTASGLVAAIPGVGPVVEVLLGAALLAQRSLVDHVRAVRQALGYGLCEARHAVSMIVGRDTQDMTEAEVARAAIESAAENLSDGVVAPLFWFALLGLPGLVGYKLVNTADSMIGHRTPRHQAFGWAAARLDDVLNFVPARLTAGLIALACRQPGVLKTALRDAPLHRSVNAGWPEGAMAGALNVALSGPRRYHGKELDLAWVHPTGSRTPGPAQIDAACDILWRVWGLCLCGVIGLALV